MPRIREEIFRAKYSDSVISVSLLDAKSVPQDSYNQYGSWVAQQVSWTDPKDPTKFTLVSETPLTLCNKPIPPTAPVAVTTAPATTATTPAKPAAVTTPVAVTAAATAA